MRALDFSRECCSNRQNQLQNREIFPENVVQIGVSSNIFGKVSGKSRGKSHDFWHRRC
ncbi:hypothetical protein HMPREF3216_01152 [Gardnerella vaginalis]|uniref:Uncharacterized protein n=1 Tax=Gardnerella vaginalis TaxID=2702 RepID=A0A133NMF2_GARVA|nr:hypothetical protein HMPREF3216_01152 [Gardnerella vaginalis]